MQLIRVMYAQAFDFSPRAVCGAALSLVLLAPVAPAWAQAKGVAKAPALKGSAMKGDAAAKAMALFKAKQYAPAAASFRAAIAANRSDSNLYYYYALCLHYSGDVEGAKAIYYQIQQYFPDSSAATSARTALGGMGGTAPAAAAPVAVGRPSRVPSGSSVDMPDPAEAIASSVAELPEEAKIYFKTDGHGMIVNAAFNGRPLDVIFDTGAEITLMGKNHLRALGIPMPSGPPTGSAQGVGGGAQGTWIVPMSVSVGSMRRKVLPVHVQEELETPLLGQNFYRGMTYEIDNGSQAIAFTKKSKNGGSIYNDLSKSNEAVPFQRAGNNMIVSVKVNGKPITMFFDTGCDGIHLTTAHTRMLGLTVPDDAPIQMSTGIGGTKTSRMITLSSISLGVVEKHNISASVDRDETLPYPLLGQTFFGDCHYQIDEARHVIFLRR